MTIILFGVLSIVVEDDGMLFWVEGIIVSFVIAAFLIIYIAGKLSLAVKKYIASRNKDKIVEEVESPISISDDSAKKEEQTFDECDTFTSEKEYPENPEFNDVDILKHLQYKKAKKRIAPAQDKLFVYKGNIIGVTNERKVRCISLDGEERTWLSEWEDIQQLSVGWNHVLGLRTDGTVLSEGNNEYGQCDVSSWSDIKKVVAGHRRSYGIRKDGTVLAIGEDEYGACRTEDWTEIVQIADGLCHTLGLRADGTVLAVGRGSYSAVKVTEWQNVIKIAAENAYSFGLCADGTVVTSQYSPYEISHWKDIIDISVSSGNILGLKSDGTVVAAVQGNDHYNINAVKTWKDIISIFASTFCCLGICKDGTVVSTRILNGIIVNHIYERDRSMEWEDIVAVTVDCYQPVGLRKDGTVLTSDLECGGFFEISEEEYPKNFGFSEEYSFTNDKPIFEYEHFVSSKEEREEAERLIDAFHEGELQELEETFGYDFAGLYIGGTYQKVLRLYSSVPTFDASDREYDSYRVTLFIRDKFDKYYLAKYSGGYALARLTIYGELTNFPKKYEELLKRVGIEGESVHMFR